jgi:arylsulfatase A-like enzyme
MNVLLILIDTLRADHLGCYGYRYDTTPHLDRLAAEGVLFENCFAPGIPTLPAHTTIYTGRHPIAHNIVSHGGEADLDEAIPVFPELLQAAGYTTTAAVDNLVDLKPWLGRGYDAYLNPAARHRLGLLVSCEEINGAAIHWLKEQGHRSSPPLRRGLRSRGGFFLFLHYWEPHTPYLPPERFRQFYDGDPFDPTNQTLAGMEAHPLGQVWRETWFPKLGGHVTDGEYIRSLYDGEVRHADEGVGTLLAALERLGLAEDTLVIVTSDHGETFYERGIFFDHHGLYDENIRVPLLLRWPGHLPAGRRVPHLVQHLDLAPTILTAAGLDIPPEMEGHDLGPLARGDCGLRIANCELRIDRTPGNPQSAIRNPQSAIRNPQVDRVVCVESTWQCKWALRTLTHKFILAREPDFYGTPPRELYDLQADPGERHNLVDAEPARSARMEAELEGWIAHRLTELGRDVDPVVAQGLTLGRRWRDAREGKGQEGE